MSRFGSRPFKILEQYPTGLVVIVVLALQQYAPYLEIKCICVEDVLSFFLDNANLVNKSASLVRYTEGFICKVHKGFSTFLLSCSGTFFWDLRSVSVSGDLIKGKLGKKRRKMLQKSMKERTSVSFIGILKSGIASVVWLATSRRLEQSTCPRYSMFFVKIAHFFNL